MVVLTWKQSLQVGVAGLVMLNDDQMLLSWQRQGKGTIREGISSPNYRCTFDDYWCCVKRQPKWTDGRLQQPTAVTRHMVVIASTPGSTHLFRLYIFAHRRSKSTTFEKGESQITCGRRK
jgi:hypothetical protein